MPGEFRRRELIDNTFVVTHVVDDHHDGWRADRYLKRQYRSKSRNQLQNAIEEGRITLSLRLGMPEGYRFKPSTVLKSGDEVKVFTPKITEEPAVDLEYKVLYEDEYLMVVDKPGNLPIHPAGRFLFNTLLTHLRTERAAWLDGGDRNFFLIHRLDRETSGAVVIAKRRHVAAALIRQFFDRKTEKRYWAVARGHCASASFTVDADIGPGVGSEIRLKMGPYPAGTWREKPESGIQSASTHFEVARRGRGVDLIDCRLETGRQHQIRVHLAYKGHPVVGDKLYGGHEHLFLKYITEGRMTDEMRAVLGFHRHALHSRYLRFHHPELGRWIEVESPLPKDMEGLLE